MAESYGVVAVLSVDGKNFQVGLKQAQKSLGDFSGSFQQRVLQNSQKLCRLLELPQLVLLQGL